MIKLSSRRWILLRGLAREQRHWGDFPQKFQMLFPKDQVHLLDLPGVGENVSGKSPLSIQEIARNVRDQAQRLPGEGPFSLLALSLGGMVALSWFDEHPEDLREAVIVNSSSRLSPFYQRLRWESWRQFITSATSPDIKAREQGVLNLVANNEEQKQKVLSLWIKIAREKTISRRAVLSQLSAASRYKVPSKVFGDQLLFVVCMGDKLVEPICSEHLAHHFQSPLIRHPWSGHDIAVDDPQWLLEQIKKWTNKSRHGVQDGVSPSI